MPFMPQLHALTPVRLIFSWLAATMAAWPAVSLAQSNPAVSTIVAFSGSQAGSGPAVGPDGALYGTTATTTTVTGGLIYRADANGDSIRTIYQLRPEDGFSPVAGLLVASDGLLYGSSTLGDVTQLNTTGTVFKIAPDGSGFTVLHRFEVYSSTNSLGNVINADGASPEAELVEGSDGRLYGTTRVGGANGNGVVFRIGRDGTGFTVLHAFQAITSDPDVIPALNPDGYGPLGPLAVGSDGFFYGTTAAGGPNGTGTIYRLRFDGTGFETLHAFEVTTTDDSGLPVNAGGANPIAGLVDGGDGRLYGTTNVGGSLGNGTIFAYDPVGRVLSTLHEFDGLAGGRSTAEMLLADDGRLYGSTVSGGTAANGNPTTFGTLFSIARDGTAFTVLHSFEGGDGSSPSGRMVQLDGSTFAGVAQGGGKCSQGVLYQLSLSGAEVDGITNCGRKQNSGGGSASPLLLLLLGVLGAARAARRA